MYTAWLICRPSVPLAGIQWRATFKINVAGSQLKIFMSPDKSRVRLAHQFWLPCTCAGARGAPYGPLFNELYKLI